MQADEFIRQFGMVTLQAYLTVSTILSDAQKVSHKTGHEVKAGDKTLVTETDTAIGDKLRKIFMTEFPGVAINAEDTESATGDSDFIILFDPVDGTRALTIGIRTSTIIIALYSKSLKEIVYCFIGEPATGRTWSTKTYDHKRTEAYELQPRADRQFPDMPRQCKVWQGKLDEQSVVFIDIQHDFSKEGRTMLNKDNMEKLCSYLARTVKLWSSGSNGLSQSLVANGCNGVAGIISTAISGPWDIAGVKLILDAGGAAQSWRLTDTRKLEPVPPLDILAADFFIGANSRETLTQLASYLHRCLE